MTTLGTAVAFGVRRLVEPVEAMHRTIADGWFGTVGSVGEAVALPTRLVTSITYGAIDAAAGAMGFGIDALRDSDDGHGHRISAVVDGLWGDDEVLVAARSRPSLTVANANGRTVHDDVAAVFPDAERDVVVFIHGLIESPDRWLGSPDDPGLVERIGHRAGVTPAVVRYVSGLPIEENGRLLAAALARMHDHWPVPMRSLTLVGYSMGGLVIRSAGLAARREGQDWVTCVTDIITVAAPHRGTPLERGVSMLERGLGIAPQTRPLADFLGRRSQGVRDLAQGDIGHAAAASTFDTPDGVWGDTRSHLVAGVVTGDVDHPFAGMVGDLVVSPASGTSASELERVSVQVVPGTNHLSVIDNESVVDYILDVIHRVE